MNLTTVMPSFVVDAPGNFLITLSVTNGVATSSATVTVSTMNTPPVANAGPDQTVKIGATVILNGSGSTDVDGNPLTYKWTLVTRPAGSKAVLSNPASVTPQFVADVPGSYVAQ